MENISNWYMTTNGSNITLHGDVHNGECFIFVNIHVDTISAKIVNDKYKLLDENMDTFFSHNKNRKRMQIQICDSFV